MSDTTTRLSLLVPIVGVVGVVGACERGARTLAHAHCAAVGAGFPGPPNLVGGAMFSDLSFDHLTGEDYWPWTTFDRSGMSREWVDKSNVYK